MANEYEYNYEEEGNSKRGCIAFVVVLLITALLVAGIYWWWKNYLSNKDDNGEDRVVVEDVVDEDDDRDEDDHEHEDDHDHDHDHDEDHEFDDETVSDLGESYSGSQYSFDYPEGWDVVDPSPAYKVLTVKKGNRRLEIFDINDFGGDRDFGFTGDEDSEDADVAIPKEFLKVRNGSKEYNVWLYYETGDEGGRETLHEIFDSILIEGLGELG